MQAARLAYADLKGEYPDRLERFIEEVSYAGAICQAESGKPGSA